MSTKQRTWAAAVIRGAVTLAVREGDRATAVEVVDGLVRVRVWEGGRCTIDQTLDTICEVDPVPLLEDGTFDRGARPSIAKVLPFRRPAAKTEAA